MQLGAKGFLMKKMAASGCVSLFLSVLALGRGLPASPRLVLPTHADCARLFPLHFCYRHSALTTVWPPPASHPQFPL